MLANRHEGIIGKDCGIYMVALGAVDYIIIIGRTASVIVKKMFLHNAVPVCMDTEY